MQEFSALDGAILIDKPAGPTSHDVVDAIRRRFGIKKVGHCGTLDPNATGLLIIVLGRGTKLSEKLMGDDKVYEGTIKFGETTDSYDCRRRNHGFAAGAADDARPVERGSGEVRRRPDADAADGFGHQKNGVPLYKLARKGIEVEREPRLIHIYNFRFTEYELSRSANSASPAPRALTSAASRTISARNSAAARIWRRCAAAFPANSTWRMRLPLDAILKLTTAELEKKVIPFLKLAAT
jgi:tRNA pseudouridine(55) synthase